MPRVIDLQEEGVLLSNEIIEAEKVLLFFWHGLGDVIMFLGVYEKLKQLYPDKQIDIALAGGIGQEDVIPNALFVSGEETNDFSAERFQEYDLVARTNFPCNEHQIEYTKAQWCCMHELGIDPLSISPVGGHRPPEVIENKIVGVHFQITCRPDLANIPYDVAKKVWEEIQEAGFVPIETLMRHPFHNPVNEKYDFIDCHIRECQAQVSTLAGILQSCRAFIGGVSGNFHLALTILPPESIILLEQELLAPSFTQLPITRVNTKEYNDGTVREWLGGL